MYIHVYQIIKNREPGPYNYLRHTDNRKYFSGLYHEIERKRTFFTWQEKWEKYGGVLAEKKLSLSLYMNSDMDKSEKFDHLHLVYHFTVFLNIPYHFKFFKGYLPQI